MRRLRKTCLAVLVWVTAASTLVAGIPHFVCRCPDGQASRHPGSPAEESPGCCCCKCCGSTNAAESDSGEGTFPDAPKVSTVSCCGQSNRQQPGNPVNGSTTDPGSSKTAKENGSKQTQSFGVDGSGCQKKLVQPKALSLTEYQKKAGEELPSPTPLLLEVPADSSSPPFGSGQTSWAVSRFPPPTDLVTLLQRFTI